MVWCELLQVLPVGHVPANIHPDVTDRKYLRQFSLDSILSN